MRTNKIAVAEPRDVQSLSVLRMFDVYRNYLIHEDTLINERLQRMLIIQGFLFAAEASLLPKYAESFMSLVRKPLVPSRGELGSLVLQFVLYGLFSMLIALTGAMAASFVRIALKAAREAIKYLQIDWNAHWKEEAGQLHLPTFCGGGAPNADKNGHKHILHMAAWFMVVWCVFFGAITGSMWYIWHHHIAVA